MCSYSLVVCEFGLLFKLGLDLVDFFLSQDSDRGDCDAGATSPEAWLLLERVLFGSLLNQVFHSGRGLIHKVFVILWCLFLDLSDTSWEVNALELLKDRVDFPLALLEVLLNLRLLNVSPLTSNTSLIFLEVVIELTEQVLVCILLEDVLELLEAVLVGATLTIAQEVVHLISLHSEASLEDVLKVFVKGVDLINVRVFERHSEFVFHRAYSLVEYLLDLVLVCLGSSLGHVLKELILAALSQCLKLALQV